MKESLVFKVFSLGRGCPYDAIDLWCHMFQSDFDPNLEHRKAIEGAMQRALECMPLAFAGDMAAMMLKLHTKS